MYNYGPINSLSGGFVGGNWEVYRELEIIGISYTEQHILETFAPDKLTGMLAAGPPCRMPAPGSLQASELGVELASGLGMAGKVDKIPPDSVRTSCCDILWSCTDVLPVDAMLFSPGFLKGQKNKHPL